MKKEAGQTIIILLLAMLVALTIGLSLVQSSISDLANSTKVEQSSRAFSAAEAGIEQALADSSNTTVSSTVTGNQSNATVTVTEDLPPSNVDALEYPPVGRADLAHFWLASPTDLTDVYKRKNVFIYFGNSGLSFDSNDIPAIEVNLITKSIPTGAYFSNRYFFDPVSSRVSTNNFTLVPATNCNQNPGVGVTTSYSDLPSPANRYFYCKQDLDIDFPATDPILIRIRVLYSNKNQSVAVGKGDKQCNGERCNLPPQATLYTSKGSAGQTEKVLTVFKEKNVVLSFFDYAIFSNSDITK